MPKRPLYYIYTEETNHYIVMLLQQDLPHYMVLHEPHFLAYRKEFEAKGYSFLELQIFQDAMQTYLESLSKKEQNGDEN